jgi:hypothetical protein
MMIALTIIGVVLSFVVTFCFYRKLQNMKLIKGWSWEAVPRGHGYDVTILDPDGNQWGHQGYDTKIPYMVDGRGYRGSSYHQTWYMGSPRWIKFRIVKCARKKASNERIEARQKVAGTF